MPRYVQTHPTEHLAKLLMAIRAGNVEAFEEILAKEGLLSARNNADYKLLKKTLLYGRWKMAEILLDRGCRAYKRFHNDNSPLHLAASKRNCSKIVRRLLDHGARVDQKNRANETPLHVAFHLAEGKIVDLMLEHHLRSSFANESNAIGMTYLHIAATRKQLDNVRCLVEFGNAQVNGQIDKKSNSPYAGFTPLHMAVKFHNPKVAELLLNNGADLWMPGNEGSSFHLARQRNNDEMMELFFQYGYKKENFVNDSGPSPLMTSFNNERIDEFTNLTYEFANYIGLLICLLCIVFDLFSVQTVVDD